MPINNILQGIPSKALFNQSIVDVFVLQGILDLEDAEKLKKHFKTNREIENFLIKNRLVTRETINKAYSIILKLPFIELKNIEIPSEVLNTIPEKIAQKYGVIPFDVSDRLLKIAVTNPADLPLGFSFALSKLFKKGRVKIELFITLPEDLREALKQYKESRKKSFLIKKGSLPVVYLRNRQIPRLYLNKVPKSFIEKYRLVVFDENISGDYMVACEKPDSSITKKILNYIKKENKVTLEIFAVSKDDIDYVLENYDHNSSFQMEPLQEDKEEINKEFEIKEREAGEKPLSSSIFSSISDLLFKPDEPGLTIDSITKKNRFPKSSKERIIIDKEDDNNENIHPNSVIPSEANISSEDNIPTASVVIPDSPSVIPTPSSVIPTPSRHSRTPLVIPAKAGIHDSNKNSVNLVGKIQKDYLSKLPKEFIQKYRLVVFGENDSGELMVATDSPGSELTGKAIEFIKTQHPVEVFTTSENDIEYAVNIYE